MFIPADPHQIAIGDVWIDVDLRNAQRTDKRGRKLRKAKHRTVQIISLPTLSSPGTMKVLTAPQAPHTIGAVREFTRDNLVLNYAKAR
jgi:hypothetical protein